MRANVHRVWRSAPALEYISAGARACVGAQMFAKLLGSGRIWLTEEDSTLRKCSRTRPPLVPAPACVRACVRVGNGEEAARSWVMVGTAK